MRIWSGAIQLQHEANLTPGQDKPRTWRPCLDDIAAPPFAFEIPSRFIEILTNVKLKLAVLRDPEITPDKEPHWEANSKRGCNEVDVKSFPPRMREVPRREGTVPAARVPSSSLIVLVWIKAALRTPQRLECSVGLLGAFIGNNNTVKIFEVMRLICAGKRVLSIPGH